LVLIDKLIEAGANVTAYDPVAIEEAKRRIGNKIEYAPDMHETLLDADALIVVTEWQEFRVPNFKVISKLLTNKLIFDGRNIYEPEEMKEMGFTYYSIGRAPINV
jgi:UDPglucose 6-dehydrogenase